MNKSEIQYMTEVASAAFRLAGKDKIRILSFIDRAVRVEQMLSLVLDFVEPNSSGSCSVLAAARYLLDAGNASNAIRLGDFSDFGVTLDL